MNIDMHEILKVAPTAFYILLSIVLLGGLGS